MDEQKPVTKDIYLAAACLAVGFVLEDTIRDDPKHLKFVFSSHPELPIAKNTSELLDNLTIQSVESMYTNGQLMVSASKYAESIRHLKSIIHATD